MAKFAWSRDLILIVFHMYFSQGVVVIEDMIKINGLLRVTDQDPAILHQSLEQLSKKIPSRDVLKSSKIGEMLCNFEWTN